MPGIEVLQLALLVAALLLVAARLRVLALRRRTAHAPPRAPARGSAPAPSRRADREEWAFPDPCEPAPTGILPSTPSARRRARELATSGDSE
jgi:hypothetical protein